ncbi:MAG TPA: TIGR03435 family protein [Verrucomicrobiae bacterium]|nr:TIGR03435 family protein [Verrucomicrobiae bacterium]
MRGIIAALVLCLAGSAQTAKDLPSFDVASVKPNTELGNTININLGTVRHGEVKLSNTNMNDCIRFAYGLSSNEQIAGADWMRSYKIRFDIDAKAPPETPRDRLLLMTQRLLAERFHLTLHRESKPVAHYEIEVGKGGPKLPESTEEPDSTLVGSGVGMLNYRHIPIDTLAVLLSRQLKQPVMNRTNLKGFFDVNLTWRPDDPQPISKGPDAGSPAVPADIESRPDLFHAMQSQLGLKLMPSKSPIDVLVIDHVDQVPVGN